MYHDASRLLARKWHSWYVILVCAAVYVRVLSRHDNAASELGLPRRSVGRLVEEGCPEGALKAKPSLGILVLDPDET